MTQKLYLCRRRRLGGVLAVCIYFEIKHVRIYAYSLEHSHTCEQSTYIFNMYNVTSPVQTTQREQTHGRPKILHKILRLRPRQRRHAYIPLIAGVAHRVLAQPACASSAERNWSVYGKIKTQQRPPRPRRC